MDFSIPNTNQGNEPVAITIIFPTNVYFLSGIRDFTLQMVKNLTGFSDQWAFRFQSVVDELCNNAIEHGSAPGENIVLSFRVKRNEKLEVIVEDTGTGQNQLHASELKEIFEAKKKQDPTKIEGIRGRGLSHIVAPLSDEVFFEDLESGGTQVRVVKYFQQTKDN